MRAKDGEPGRAPHLRGERQVCLYLLYICLDHGATLSLMQSGQMAALCLADACDSNSHHGQLQMRKKSYENEADTPTSPGRRNIAN